MATRANPFAKKTSYSTSKKGWRVIGDKSIYARSSWEANYARYLEFQKANNLIKEWEHEPDTFWFDKIKRGCRSYLPDFKITKNDGTQIYHEVKGWLDPKSITKLKRMKKYHPLISVTVIGTVWFKANAKNLSNFIKGWETYR